MLIDRAREAARRALGHRDLRYLAELVPAGYRENPAAVREILRGAVEGDSAVTDNPAFREACRAVDEWGAALTLGARAAALYHIPKIQAALGDKIDWYLSHPEAAYRRLLSEPKLLPGDLRDEALGVIAEMRELGAVSPEPAAPLPAALGAQDAEYRGLITKSTRGKLTQAEEARLTGLAELRAAREDAAETKAAEALSHPAPPRTGEYQTLIAKSARGPLSAAETARLTQLAEQRAVAEGLIDADEIEADSALDGAADVGGDE